MSVRRSFVIAGACAAAGACGQPSPARRTSEPTAASAAPSSAAPAATALAGAFTDVLILADDGDPTVFYQTFTSLTDCAAQRREMPLVWHEHVRGPLTTARWTRVTLFPAEPSGRSASFTFQRDASGRWRAYGPCQVTIAP